MCDISTDLSKNVERRAVRIQSLFEQDRVVEAMGALLSETDRMVGVPPQNMRVATFGTEFLLAGDLQKALSYFGSVLSANDNADLALYGRALAYRLLGQDAQASADLAQAIAIAESRRQGRGLAPYGPAVLYRVFRREIDWAHIVDLPLYHLALGNIEQAEQMVREALPQAPLALLRLAARRLEDFAALFPDHAQSRTLRTMLCERLQHSDVPNPTDPEALRIAKIMAAFDIGHHIDNVVARQDARIQALFEQGQIEEAIWELDQVIVSSRQVPRVANVGIKLLLAGDLQKALSYFAGVVSANDHADWALYGRALTYRLLGQQAQANEDLAQAMAIAETCEEERRFGSDGPVARLCERYRGEITWAYRIDLPLYHLALGNIQQAEQMVREALSEAPLTLLQLAARRLADFVALFPDNVQAQALNALLQERSQQGTVTRDTVDGCVESDL